jgi:hypothetical protein
MTARRYQGYMFKRYVTAARGRPMGGRSSSEHQLLNAGLKHTNNHRKDQTMGHCRPVSDSEADARGQLCSTLI